MFVRLCLNLACFGMLCSAARIRRRVQSNWPSLKPGNYVIIADRVNAYTTAYSDVTVGQLLTKGQRIVVLETIETTPNHVVFGRIESPFHGYVPLLDKEHGTVLATLASEAHSEARCVLRKQDASFCEQSAEKMQWTLVGDKLREDKPVGVARLKFANKESKGTCYLQYAYGLATEADAQKKAMECCEESRKEKGSDENPTKECKLVGPSVSDGFEAKCNFRLGKKWFMKSKCYCPKERPHVLKPGSSIQWHTPGQPELLIGVEEQAVCIDECTARSLNPSQVEPKTNLKASDWPVVFLAVYNLEFGIVHSNLAFCPKSIVNKRHACLQPGASKSNCSKSHHTSEFASSNEVPRLLMEHGCRELIFDGNHGGGLWTPHETETGCWAQGMDAQEFWWDGGADGTYRTGLGYQKLFWLTSDNSVRPFADPKKGFESGELALKLDSPALSASSKQSVEMRMKKCFGDKLGNRIDFNPGTYSLLHHNCNKFSSEAMRELDLPKFYDAADKGTHGSISLSATPEESAIRRGLHKIISHFAGRSRSSLSWTCQEEFFREGKPNCRRIGWGGRKGDCPTDVFRNGANDFLRCYDPSKRSSEGTGGLSEVVAYDEHVNGVCGIPAGAPCNQYGHYSKAPCQPGFRCVESEDKNDTNKAEEVRSYCIQVEDCSSAVEHASMRESDNLVTGAWCKCPKKTNLICKPQSGSEAGTQVFDRYFNPSAVNRLKSQGNRCYCGSDSQSSQIKNSGFDVTSSV